MPEKLKPCPACGDPYPRMVEHETFAYVACDTSRCRLTGPVAETEEGAVRKWNTLARSPRRLRWSKEPPKEPGWYWHSQPPHFGVVIEYFDPDENTPSGAQWAGPIPEPEERQ